MRIWSEPPIEDLAEKIIIVDTPDRGRPADLTALPYVHLPTDHIYPFIDGYIGNDD